MRKGGPSGHGAGPDGRGRGLSGPGPGRGEGPAGARTQPARPLPAAMLAGVWVSNRAGSGCDSSGSSRSRLLSSTGGRSRAPGSARRSAGEPGPRGSGAGADRGRGPCPSPERPKSAAPPPPPGVYTPQSQSGLYLRPDPLLPNRPRPTGWSTAPPRLGPHSSAGTPPPPPRPTAFPSGSSSFGILGAPGFPRPPQLREPVQASPSTFPLDPPCPSSPGGAPPPSSRCRPPPFGLPRAPSPPQGPGSPFLPHGTAGTGAAEPGSSCLLFRVGWRDPAPRSCRAGRGG